MATKSAEVLLAVEYRTRGRDGRWQGGPMDYMDRGLGMPFLAGVFCVLCVLASFGIGNATQVGEPRPHQKQLHPAAPLSPLV